MRILITGSRAPVALDFSRRFQRAGHQVFHADSLKYGLGMLTNSAAQAFHVPRPVDSPRTYADALSKIVDEQQIDWLIPTCEEVFFIAAHQKQLDCNVLVDDFRKLASIHNKWEFSQLAGNDFGAVPETHLLENTTDLQAVLDRLPPEETLDDWVFKPVYSRFATRTLIGPSQAELKRLQATEEQPWIAQRRIRGTEFSSYSIARGGTLLAHAAYRSLYRVGTGSGICFQPVEHHGMEQFVAAFAQRHSFSGQIGFDFIVDRSDRLWVLEGNPRATSGAQLFAESDPLADALLLQADDLIRPSSTRPAMIEFAMPLWGLADAVRQGKWLRYLPDLLRSRWMTVSLRDPWPTLGLPRALWEIASIARREARTLQQASTFDIEWNGETM